MNVTAFAFYFIMHRLQGQAGFSLVTHWYKWAPYIRINDHCEPELSSVVCVEMIFAFCRPDRFTSWHASEVRGRRLSALIMSTAFKNMQHTTWRRHGVTHATLLSGLRSEVDVRNRSMLLCLETCVMYVDVRQNPGWASPSLSKCQIFQLNISTWFDP